MWIVAVTGALSFDIVILALSTVTHCAPFPAIVTANTFPISAGVSALRFIVCEIVCPGVIASVKVAPVTVTAETPDIRKQDIRKKKKMDGKRGILIMTRHRIPSS